MNSGTPRWRVRNTREIDYEIVTVPDLFDPANARLARAGGSDSRRRFVVIDANVARIYGRAIGDYFRHHGIEARIVTCAGGEENKGIDTYLRLARELASFPIHRRDEPIIAIGGGVVTDVVGFLASSYRRGVPHIKVPTTLMGYVDAAIGIKTAVNLDAYKNRLGSFEPPLKVFLHPAFLKTLPRRHLLNGTGEIIKLALISDGVLFEQLEAHGAHSIAAHFQNPAGAAILERAVGGMLRELEPNLLETTLARSVDFGHSFSYGLEADPAARVLHGEAVLLDVALSVLIAEERGLLDVADVERLFRLIASLGIVLDVSALDSARMWAALADRVEHRNGAQHLPVPVAIGRCTFLNDVGYAEIERAAAALNQWKPAHASMLECR